MERNMNQQNEKTTRENITNNESGQQSYFWVSYPDETNKDKKEKAKNESVLETSNRFAL
jgi:hypothetical protein